MFPAMPSASESSTGTVTDAPTRVRVRSSNALAKLLTNWTNPFLGASDNYAGLSIRERNRRFHALVRLVNRAPRLLLAMQVFTKASVGLAERRPVTRRRHPQ